MNFVNLILIPRKDGNMSYTVGLISLGCPKNQVDAEQMLAALDEAGFEIVDYVDGCDAR